MSNACFWNNWLILAPILFLFAGGWDQCTCCNLLYSPLGENKRQKKSKEVSQNNLFCPHQYGGSVVEFGHIG